MNHNCDLSPKGFFRELAKNFFSYGIVGVISRFISFLTVPVFTRVFTPTEYGVLETILLIIVVLSVFGTLMLETSFLRFFFDEEDPSYRRDVFSTGLFTFTPVSFLLTAGFLLFPAYFSKLLFHSSEYAILITIAMIRLPFKSIMEYSAVVFRVEFNRRGYAVFHISHIIVNVTLSICAVVLLNWGLVGLLAVQSGTIVVFSFIALYFARGYLNWSFSPPAFKNMLKYSLPILPATVLSYLQRYINRVLILVMYSMYSMGIFSLAIKIAMPLMIGTESLRLAWVPYAFKTWKEPDSKRNFGLFLLVYLGMAIIMVFLIASFSPEIVSIFAPSEYGDAVCLVAFIAMAFALHGASRLVAVGLGIQKKMGYLSVATLVAVVVGSAAMVLLASRFDLIGIAAGTLVAEIFGFVFLFLIIRRIFPGYFNFRLAFLLVFLGVIFLFINLWVVHLTVISRVGILILFGILLYGFYFKFVSKRIHKEIYSFLKKIF